MKRLLYPLMVFALFSNITVADSCTDLQTEQSCRTVSKPSGEKSCVFEVKQGQVSTYLNCPNCLEGQIVSQRYSIKKICREHCYPKIECNYICVNRKVPVLICVNE